MPQVERHESGAVGERLKRPWEEQWAKGPEVSVNLHWWSRPSGATARFWAAGVWNSRISVQLRFRVVKLTKVLKPEKSAQKRVQVSAQASDIRIFALTASAVCSAKIVGK